MADFGIESTHVSDPQRSGTRAVDAVQEKAVNTSDVDIFSKIGEVFAKGLAQNNKDEAEKRKNAVIGEYHNNEGVYTSALEQGSWNSSQVAAASRSNYNKFLSAYPEYASELVQARQARMDGTETGRALDEEKTAAKRRETDISAAQAAGYTFYEGQDKKSENLQIDAHKKSVLAERDFKQSTERRAEERAEQTFQDSHTIAVNNIRNEEIKQQASASLNELAKANFNATVSDVDNLVNLVTSGKMTYEQAMLTHKTNIMRFDAAATSIAGVHPELAAPWKQVFSELNDTVTKMLDPSVKTEREAKMLKDTYQSIILRAQLSGIQSDPELKQAVVAQTFFPNNSLVAVSNSPAVSRFLMKASGASPLAKGETVPKFIGTDGEGKIYDTTQKALANLQSGNSLNPERDAMEAVKTVSNMLKETSSKDGAFAPKSLKMATTFYASPEFGKLAKEGKVDASTLRQAQQVFQVQLNPVVKDTVYKALDGVIPDVRDGSKSRTVSDMVDVSVVGGQIMFKPKPIPADLNFFDTQRELSLQSVNKKSLDEGAAALTQLVRLHAHLEGETDYGKYFEKNKHMLLPGYFVQGYEKGKVIDGYEFLGGDARNPDNFKKVKK